MNFTFSEDQHLLAEGVRGFLEAECLPDDVARAWEHGWDRTRWKSLAGLGVVGLLAPESAGGMGMQEVDLVLLLEAAGYAGLPEPLGEVAAVTVPLLVDAAGARAGELLGPVVSGDQVIVPALAADPLPAHLASADRVLLEVDGALHLLDPSDATITAQPNVDGARPTASIRATSGPTTVVAEDAGTTLALAGDRGAWAAAAHLVGAARRMVDLATEYAGQREQFGKPIGSFQAVKHHLATALVSVEFARPLVHRAAWSLATGQTEASLHCSMAKARAAEAAEAAALAALQVHGAIGYTWEHHLHLWMKRTWSLAASWGTTEEHWQQVEAAIA